MNIQLKVAIVQSRKSQNEVAAASGMTIWRLSRLVNDREKPTRDEQRRIARVLHRRIEDVFPGVTA